MDPPSHRGVNQRMDCIVANLVAALNTMRCQWKVGAEAQVRYRVHEGIQLTMEEAPVSMVRLQQFW